MSFVILSKKKENVKEVFVIWPNLKNYEKAVEKFGSGKLIILQFEKVVFSNCKDVPIEADALFNDDIVVKEVVLEGLPHSNNRNSGRHHSIHRNDENYKQHGSGSGSYYKKSRYDRGYSRHQYGNENHSHFYRRSRTPEHSNRYYPRTNSRTYQRGGHHKDFCYDDKDYYHHRGGQHKDYYHHRGGHHKDFYYDDKDYYHHRRQSRKCSVHRSGSRYKKKNYTHRSRSRHRSRSINSNKHHTQRSRSRHRSRTSNANKHHTQRSSANETKKHHYIRNNKKDNSGQIYSSQTENSVAILQCNQTISVPDYNIQQPAKLVQAVTISNNITQSIPPLPLNVPATNITQSIPPLSLNVPASNITTALTITKQPMPIYQKEKKNTEAKARRYSDGEVHILRKKAKKWQQTEIREEPDADEDDVFSFDSDSVTESQMCDLNMAKKDDQDYEEPTDYMVYNAVKHTWHKVENSGKAIEIEDDSEPLMLCNPKIAKKKTPVSEWRTFISRKVLYTPEIFRLAGLVSTATRWGFRCVQEVLLVAMIRGEGEQRLYVADIAQIILNFADSQGILLYVPQPEALYDWWKLEDKMTDNFQQNLLRKRQGVELGWCLSYFSGEKMDYLYQNHSNLPEGWYIITDFSECVHPEYCFAKNHKGMVRDFNLIEVKQCFSSRIQRLFGLACGVVSCRQNHRGFFKEWWMKMKEEFSHHYYMHCGGEYQWIDGKYCGATFLRNVAYYYPAEDRTNGIDLWQHAVYFMCLVSYSKRLRLKKLKENNIVVTID